MFERREIIDFLQDAISAMEKAERFVSDMTYEEFINDEKTIFAVIVNKVSNVPSVNSQAYID